MLPLVSVWGNTHFMGREILNRNAHKYEIRVEYNVFFTHDNFIIVEGLL